MKDFFKNVGATIVGLLLFTLILGGFAIISIVGMIAGASSDSKPSIPSNSVLVLQMKGQLDERSSSSPFSILNQDQTPPMGLNDILYSIKKAKDDPKIKGIYIENDGFSADPSQLEEIRNALKDYKTSKKWIVAYGDSYGSGSYYLASIADKIYLNPQGTIEWKGIGSETMYVKDALKKIGVSMIVTKVGKYKSATEMYTEDKMSDANREQTMRYISGIWNKWVSSVSESRKISAQQLNAYADRFIESEDPKVFVANKMVDKLLYSDEMKAEVKKMFGLKEDEDISQVTPSQLLSATSSSSNGGKIAVYYASGEIVDQGNPSSIFDEENLIVGDDVCKDMEELMNDDDVKAVVLRVNSPGGSAFASDKMWHAIQQLKKKKPVIVSMSGMAASGGYYMSCGANWIVAEPTTITGSIGIFGMIPDATQLFSDKLGIKFDEVSTNKHSTLGAMGRKMTPEEIGYIQASVDRGYRVFLSRVAEGRHMTVEKVNELAQGHVYLGQDALQIKLVDEMGGINQAIEKAAKLAKLKDYYYEEYPSPLSFLDQLSAFGNKGTYLDEQLREVLGDFYQPFSVLSRIKSQNAIQARMPYFVLYN